MSKIAIVGGGPAGCATALALYEHGVRDVTIIEAGRYGGPRIGESVPPNIRTLFAQAGILGAFLGEGHEACTGSCSAWGSSELGFNDFIANPHGAGWHLDRERFESFLAAEVVRRGVILMTETRLRDVQPRGDGFTLSVEDRSRERFDVDADFVVDAGGMQALAATRLGARKRILDRLVAVCAFFDLPDEAGLWQLTMLEAVDYGWWYAAKLPRQRVAVAVATEPAIFKSRRLHAVEAWEDHFGRTRHVRAALADATWPARELTVQLAPSMLLEPTTGPGWVAVGDAASCYDPITSQGIYKAFANGIAAARAVTDHLKGASGALQTYRAQIRGQFSEYLRNRHYFYNLEQRWPDSRFWATRQQRSAPI